MKHSFLKKLMNLLEKEVCQREEKKLLDHCPITKLTPIQIEKIKKQSQKSLLKTKTKEETLLSEGVSIKGKLIFKELLKVEGSYEGELEASGKILVEKSGVIRGNISVDEVEVYGSITGNITAKKIILRKNSVVIGDLKAPIVTIEEGATFQGYYNVGDQFEPAGRLKA